MAELEEVLGLAQEIRDAMLGTIQEPDKGFLPRLKGVETIAADLQRRMISLEQAHARAQARLLWILITAIASALVGMVLL